MPLQLGLVLLAIGGGVATPAAAGSGVPGSILPQTISPGLSQNCIDKLDPKLRGVAANRAARACRRPTGPQNPVKAETTTAKPATASAIAQSEKK